MLERKADPKRARGYGKNLAREQKKKKNRRNALAPMTTDTTTVESIAIPDEDDDQLMPKGAPIVMATDHAAQFRSAAAATRYMSAVLETYAPMLVGAAEEIESNEALSIDHETVAKLVGAPTDQGLSLDNRRAEMNALLSFVARLRRDFLEGVEANATQVALAIRAALSVERPKDADQTKWILSCVRFDFPDLALNVTDDARARLGKLGQKATDREVAAIAVMLVGEQTTVAAIKKARSRKRRK